MADNVLAGRKPSIVARAKAAWHILRGGYSQPPGWARGWRQQTAWGQSKAVPLLWPEFRLGQPQWQIVDFRTYAEEGFTVNALIYSAIMYKVRALSHVRLGAYSGSWDSPEPLDESHALAQLVARPNRHQSWQELQAQCEVYLNLAGNVYMLLDRPKRGELPRAIYALRPDRTYVVPDQRKNKPTLMGYLYVPEGRSPRDGMPILPEDLMHPKLPNPLDPLEGMGYGLSPLSALAQSADVDNMVTKFLYRFFESGTMFGSLLKFKTPLTDDVVGAIRERWEEVYGGYENWHKVGLLDRGGEYQRVGMTFQEMGFENIDERNESRILAPFGVPGLLIGTRIGLQRAIRANAKELRTMFWEDTMIPELRLFNAEYRYYLQTDDGAFVKFDTSSVPALQKNLPAVVEAWAALVDRGVPKDIAAHTVGLPLEALPDDGVGYMPMNVIPVTSKLKEPERGEEGQAEAESDERQDGKRRKGRLRKGVWTPEAKNRVGKAFDQVAVAWEDRFGQAAHEQFDSDKGHLLAILSAKKSFLARKQSVQWLTIFTDWQQYILNVAVHEWRKKFMPLMSGLVEAQGNQWAVRLGMEFDIRNLLAEQWFQDYTLKFARQVSETTESTVKDLVAQGMQEGWSVDQMANRMETVFDQWMTGLITPEEFAWFEERRPGYRREMIARTETIRASNYGTNRLFQQWGIEGKEWLTTQDDRTCFPAGTLVETEGGPRSIEELHLGMKVLTHSGYRRIKKCFSRSYSGDFTLLMAGGQSIVSTSDHPVWAVSRGWVKAKNFNIGDRIQLLDNQTAEIIGCVNFTLPNPENCPSVLSKISLLASVFSGVLMPILAVYLKRQLALGKSKVNAICPDLSFLGEVKFQSLQSLTNAGLQSGLAGISTVTGKRTEHAITGRGRSEFLSALLTSRVLRGTVAFLRAVHSFIQGTTLDTKLLSAGGAGAHLGTGCPAFPAAHGESICIGLTDCELPPTNRADFGSCVVLRAVRPIAFPTAEQLLAALSLAGGNPKAFATLQAFKIPALPGALMVASAATVFLRIVARIKLAATELTNAILGHSLPPMSLLFLLYHGWQGMSNVYNLQIEGDPTYFANGILVHNCSWCLAMDGKVIGVGQSFWHIGDTMEVEVEDSVRHLSFTYEDVIAPPLHPNCRCTLLPWKKEWEELGVELPAMEDVPVDGD